MKTGVSKNWVHTTPKLFLSPTPTVSLRKRGPTCVWTRFGLAQRADSVKHYEIAGKGGQLQIHECISYGKTIEILQETTRETELRTSRYVYKSLLRSRQGMASQRPNEQQQLAKLQCTRANEGHHGTARSTSVVSSMARAYFQERGASKTRLILCRSRPAPPAGIVFRPLREGACVNGIAP